MKEPPPREALSVYCYIQKLRLLCGFPDVCGVAGRTDNLTNFVEVALKISLIL